MLYTDIQTPLLVYLLPFCLEGWRYDLLGERTEYGGFVEYFYTVLANRGVFDLHLNRAKTAAVSEFMRATILEEIDSQRGLSYQGSHARPYRWVRALTTFGVLLPEVESLWAAWWSVESVGRAIAAVQYISCLMYAENENPIFAPWTPERGGGPPGLWEYEGHLYKNRWLDPNIQFLEATLSADAASDMLRKAVERLVGEPEHGVAAEIYRDLPLCADTLASRCADLPRLLETTQPPTRSWPR